MFAKKEECNYTETTSFSDDRLILIALLCIKEVML